MAACRVSGVRAGAQAMCSRAAARAPATANACYSAQFQVRSHIEPRWKQTSAQPPPSCALLPRRALGSFTRIVSAGNMPAVRTTGHSKLTHLQPWGNDVSVPSPETGGLTPTAHRDFLIRHTCPGIGRLTDTIITDGHGSWVRTDMHQALLDMSSGIGVTSLGHAHPEVAAAVCKQAQRVNHAQVSVAWHTAQCDLVDKFLDADWFPKGLDRFFFWNSGSEAIEAAMKVARHATKKDNIIVFQGGYHGRTVGAMSLTTSKTIYRAGFGPLMPGVFVTPFPYWHANGHVEPITSPSELTAAGDAAIAQFELLLRQQSAPSDTAAVIIEPVLGEGGYVPAPPGFLKKLSDLCKQHKILLIADEVQTGFGRTGTKFAVDHDGIVPDILVFAKGVANGYPLSGIASSFDLMEGQPPGSMGGTYSANAVSCAAAWATLDVLERDEVLENVNVRSRQLFDGLRRLQKDADISASSKARIADVRGRGLMVGVEFGTPHSASDASTGIASAVSKECAERGMLLLSTGAYDTVRFIPALNVSAEEIDAALTIFEEALKAVASR